MGDYADMAFDDSLARCEAPTIYDDGWDDVTVNYKARRDLLSRNKTLVYPHFKLVRETEKAWLINIKEVDHWFPKSLCSLSKTKFTSPMWLLYKKDIVKI